MCLNIFLQLIFNKYLMDLRVKKVTYNKNNAKA